MTANKKIERLKKQLNDKNTFEKSDEEMPYPHTGRVFEINFRREYDGRDAYREEYFTDEEDSEYRD